MEDDSHQKRLSKTKMEDESQKTKLEQTIKDKLQKLGHEKIGESNILLWKYKNNDNHKSYFDRHLKFAHFTNSFGPSTRSLVEPPPTKIYKQKNK